VAAGDDAGQGVSTGGSGFNGNGRQLSRRIEHICHWHLRRSLADRSGTADISESAGTGYGLLPEIWRLFTVLCLVGGVLRTPLWLFTILVLSGKFLRYAVVAWLTLR
jgi:hypothetical protein